ncbi:MAG: CoA transferase [Pseudomonadota bacterium]|nr:CoA transferase [Pseudomonadota bacterium]
MLEEVKVTSAQGGPLAGIRIVEIDAIGPVPLAAMIMADMGADIVRVGRRAFPGKQVWGEVGGAVLHRSRDYVALDLKDPADRDDLLGLIERADGLVEGFRPGVMERLGLGPDVCLARNPRLVFGRMTGWGQSGPMAMRAGHDINYLSLTGALHAIGNAGAPPTVPLNLVGDYGGGAMFLVAGMLAGFLSAQRTGKGQVVDVAITDGVGTLLSLFRAWLPTGGWIDQRASNLLDGEAPFYRCYACADGKHVAVGCLEPQFFAAMAAGLGLEHRQYDQGDRREWPAMAAEFAAAFAARSRDEWAEHFTATDACVTPVLSLSEAIDHRQAVERASFAFRNGIAQASPAPRFAETPAVIGDPALAELADVLRRWSAAEA